MKKNFMISLRDAETEESRIKRAHKKADKHLDDLEVHIGKPFKEMGVEDLEVLLRQTTILLFMEIDDHKAAANWKHITLNLIAGQEAAAKKRVENRPINMVKLAFQNALKVNMDDYPNIAYALRDLRSKPQFADIPETTLRSWAKGVWLKSLIVGRPRKN